MDMFVVIGINLDIYAVDDISVDAYAQVLHITADYDIAQQKREAHRYDYDIVRILEGEWNE